MKIHFDISWLNKVPIKEALWCQNRPCPLLLIEKNKQYGLHSVVFQAILTSWDMGSTIVSLQFPHFLRCIKNIYAPIIQFYVVDTRFPRLSSLPGFFEICSSLNASKNVSPVIKSKGVETRLPWLPSLPGGHRWLWWLPQQVFNTIRCFKH